MCCAVTQSCPTLCDPMDCSQRQAPLSMGILQARILEWVAIPPPGDLPDSILRATQCVMNADKNVKKIHKNENNLFPPKNFKNDFCFCFDFSSLRCNLHTVKVTQFKRSNLMNFCSNVQLCGPATIKIWFSHSKKYAPASFKQIPSPALGHR